MGPDEAANDAETVSEDLRDTLRTVLRERASITDLPQRVTDDGVRYDEALWRSLAQDIGALGVAVPEDLGGLGMPPSTVGLVLEELGRSLAPSAFFSSIALACQALVMIDDRRACEDLVPPLVQGELTATVALDVDATSFGANDVAARSEGAGWSLTGRVDGVIDAASSDIILVPARTARGLSLFVVEAGDRGVTTRRTAHVDLTRNFGEVELLEATARLVGLDGGADRVLARLSPLAMVSLAAEQVGGARGSLDQAVAWAGTRHQFGRSIGSFQAIKHRLVDVLLEVDGAAAAVQAAWALVDAEDRHTLNTVAMAARLQASRAFMTASLTNVQVHGGIGFTWEHPAHLYMRRAKSSELMFWPPARLRQDLGRALGY